MTKDDQQTDAKSLVYSKIHPAVYIKENFPPDDPIKNKETQGLLTFLHKSLSKINFPKGNKTRLVEVGGGPTVYQLISARRVVDEIYFTDYEKKWWAQVRKWVRKDKQKANWTEYFRFTLRLELGREPTKQEIIEASNCLREKIVKTETFDLFDNERWPINYEDGFDVASMHFCIESIVSSAKLFEKGMENFFLLVKPNGYASLSFLKNSPYYLAGNKKIGTFPIDENYLKDFLEKEGFKIIEMETIPADKTGGDYGPYEGDICILARKLAH